MTDHHDDFAGHDHHYTGGEDDHHIPYEEPAAFDDVHHDLAWADPQHDDPPDLHMPDLPEAHVEPDLSTTDDPADVFPPTIDVGPLPEPVDGFPWIDTGSLGLVDPATVHATVDPVDPHELAEYAGTELPPGVDPWAALADSDDPATATLARWWAEHQQ